MIHGTRTYRPRFPSPVASFYYIKKAREPTQFLAAMLTSAITSRALTIPSSVPDYNFYDTRQHDATPPFKNESDLTIRRQITSLCYNTTCRSSSDRWNEALSSALPATGATAIEGSEATSSFEVDPCVVKSTPSLHDSRGERRVVSDVPG